ncbi:rab escort protein 1-like [Nicotiana tabacum]|uniref:Rab escort protein 1-like n=3 Tax=Nicotiana TaxID=4085 RepID=A0AC58TYM3_TOBAC|nr:rab escort protein 1 [Nicotiana tomentosiformis]XP_016453998.1 PREDICTED: rab proteins geranylgeranyltransferase component A 2-like [Nicotiana tabacum]XP_033513443.1 rab escort protein 1 [Nicotiana tomentosiformis]
MDETASYPPIEPSNFDLIVVGTGLPESILAAAAAAAGKSVLHLDPNPSYGSHYASFPLHEFISYIQSQSSSEPSIPQPDADSGFTRVPLTTRSLYSSVEITSYSSEPLEQSRKFNIDLSGPRVLLCADAMINLILKSEVNQYMEFKSIDGNFFYDGEGNLENVPDSRSAIFKDRKLSFTEKNQLMGFFKLVQGHFEAFATDGGESKSISEEDLDSPFVEFLSKMGLSSKLKSIILYAITMADYDQENGDVCKSVLNTKDGIDRLALYHSSVGRFPNASGAMIYPIYGQGELPQAFCRRAAVKGCIYVLRMPVNSLLMDKATGNYKGVRLASEQELFSHKLILAPSFVFQLPPPHASPDALQIVYCDFGSNNTTEKLARSVCITKHSLKLDVANCLAFFPPRSLFPEQVTAIHVLQLSSNVAVCPSGMFLTYLSAICEDDVQGKKLLHAAINALFCIPVSGSSENDNSAENQSETRDAKPALLWSVLYTQELAKFQDVLDNIISTPMPDGSPYYHDLLGATEKIFEELYSGEEFFPKTASSEEGAVEELED